MMIRQESIWADDLNLHILMTHQVNFYILHIFLFSEEEKCINFFLNEKKNSLEIEFKRENILIYVCNLFSYFKKTLLCFIYIL